MSMETLHISMDKALLDIPKIHDFLTNRSYWAQGRTLEEVKRSIDNSLCFGVYDGSEQIAFARVISDLTITAYIMDLFVMEDYRGRGIGKMLVDRIVGYPDFQGLKFMRLDTLDGHGLYRQFGFKEVKYPDRLMERRPKA